LINIITRYTEEDLKQISRIFEIHLKERLNPDDKYEVTYPNFNKCIKISNVGNAGPGGSLFIWVRLLYYDKFIVDISNICLPEYIRRKGVLTNIINDLMKLDNVLEVKISGVSTEEMFRFCKKMNMKQVSQGDYSLS
jgi:hypothetical protein